MQDPGRTPSPLLFKVFSHLWFQTGPKIIDLSNYEKKKKKKRRKKKKKKNPSSSTGRNLHVQTYLYIHIYKPTPMLCTLTHVDTFTALTISHINTITHTLTHAPSLTHIYTFIRGKHGIEIWNTLYTVVNYTYTDGVNTRNCQYCSERPPPPIEQLPTFKADANSTICWL